MKITITKQFGLLKPGEYEIPDGAATKMIAMGYAVEKKERKGKRETKEEKHKQNAESKNNTNDAGN
jgi:hypothetical protein